MEPLGSRRPPGPVLSGLAARCGSWRRTPAGFALRRSLRAAGSDLAAFPGVGGSFPAE